MTSPTASPAIDRVVRVVGTRNLRDIGGYPTRDGRRTRWRTLFRADCLDRLPASSQEELVALGIRQVIDLRWPSELATHPNVFRDSPRVRYRHVPLLDDDPTPRVGLAGTYRHVLDERSEALVTVIRSLLDPDGLPAIIHCAAGKDRTGVTVGLILSAVGVANETIVEDYALSKTCLENPWSPDGREEIVIVECPPEHMAGTLEHLDRHHGGAETYLRGVGLSGTELGRLENLLTEPSA